MPRLSKIGAAALAAFGWTSGSSVTASYLVVAGGGGGGHGGGGGAGGLLTGTASLNPTLSYTVTVGAGGTAETYPSPLPTNGNNSVFSTITATGGGKGAAGSNAAGNGGSGGGASGTPYGSGALGTGTSGQGSNGGSAAVAGCGGGGGASAVGGNGSGGTGGAGGAGTASSISGSSVTYAGGGGAGGDTAGAGGAGGGGAGASGDNNGTAGTANTGGGGGGMRASSGFATVSGAGGSGIVIISYPGAQQFGGGNVTSDGTNTIHTFTTSGTLSPLSSLTAQYLIVAGGGGGGGAVNDYTLGGGGGAGGLLAGTGITIDTNSNYVVTVGAGGTGGVYNALGGNGGNSAWSMVSTTVLGGGAGSAQASPAAASGGSGGGGGSSATPAGGAGTSGQGNAGGTGVTFFGGAGAKSGGGGGGAGAVGGTASGATAGAGGIGVASSISGTSTYYAGGGGGASSSAGAAGGTGGGGAGVTYNNDGVAGTANTGGGGGGAARNNSAGTQVGGAGGSGVVIISYPGATQQMAGGTVTISGGNVIHTFTSSGYLTPIKYASRSLRFRSSASAYLNRTFSTPTNSLKWTWSGWVKNCTQSGYNPIFGVDSNSGGLMYFHQTANALQFYDPSTGAQLYTTALYRDPSAWYHILFVYDSTQATAADRMNWYVNGVKITSFANATYPSQNASVVVNTAVVHYIGRHVSAGTYANSYMTEINFVDGQALTPSSFGAYNSYGVWQPITYGGSYGTNGFYLTFGNNTSTTTLGYDTSPQGNNWTTNNISLTAGVTYDSMTDVPTLTSSTVNNYCVLNPLIQDYTGGGTGPGPRNGNLQLYRASGSGWGMCGSTFGVSSGKWYWEAITENGSGSVSGIHKTQPTGYAQIVGYNEPNGYGYSGDGNKLNNNTGTAYGATYTTGDVIGIALDMDAGTLTFYKNNTSQGVAFSGLSGTFMPAFSAAGPTSCNANFGQQPFIYTPPSGFVALNTYNLSTPTIPNGATQMAATLYTGTNTTQSIANTVNGTNFQPDFVWFKSRATTYAHALFDSVRGVTKGLETNSANNEQTSTAGNDLAAFTSTGFTVGAPQNWNSPNNSGSNPVAWQWKAGNSSGVTNTDGILTSTVSANTTAGFSICTYTAPVSSQANSFGHGLGVAPSMVIAKSRSSGSGGLGWAVYHTSLGANQYLSLNSTAAASTVSGYWGSGMTSTVVGLRTGSSSSGSDNVTGNMVAYVFAAIAGYSAFGSYTGNGSADGPFVFLGFRPRFIMWKRTDAVANWFLLDSTRTPANPVNLELYADQTSAETTFTDCDFVSNGFKLRTSNTDRNASGGTYIYMAFAENPFKYSNAR